MASETLFTPGKMTHHAKSQISPARPWSAEHRVGGAGLLALLLSYGVWRSSVAPSPARNTVTPAGSPTIAPSAGLRRPRRSPPAPVYLPTIFRPAHTRNILAPAPSVASAHQWLLPTNLKLVGNCSAESASWHATSPAASTPLARYGRSEGQRVAQVPRKVVDGSSSQQRYALLCTGQAVRWMQHETFQRIGGLSALVSPSLVDAFFASEKTPSS